MELEAGISNGSPSVPSSRCAERKPKELAAVRACSEQPDVRAGKRARGGPDVADDGGHRRRNGGRSVAVSRGAANVRGRARGLLYSTITSHTPALTPSLYAIQLTPAHALGEGFSCRPRRAAASSSAWSNLGTLSAIEISNADFRADKPRRGLRRQLPPDYRRLLQSARMLARSAGPPPPPDGCRGRLTRSRARRRRGATRSMGVGAATSRSCPLRRVPVRCATAGAWRAPCAAPTATAPSRTPS